MDRAFFSAAITFGLLPDVEIAMATSPGLPKGFDLTCEDLLEAEIVSRSRKRRRISVQGERRDRGAVALVADRQFGREMLGIGGAPPVSEKHQLTAAFDRLRAGFYKGRKVFSQRCFSTSGNVVMFREFRFEKCAKIHSRFPQAASPRNSGTASRRTL
jgi:hypothetical protein